MATTFQQLIDQAVSLAMRGVDASTAASLSAEMVTEDLANWVFHQVGTAAAAHPDKRSLLRKPKSISFSNGSGTITGDVLTQYLSESMLYDPTALSAVYSWIPQWEEFIRMTDRRDGYFCVNESTIAVVQPNSVYSATTGLSGSLTLVIPCVPTVPTSAGATVEVRDELIDDLAMGLADAMVSPLFRSPLHAPKGIK